MRNFGTSARWRSPVPSSNATGDSRAGTACVGAVGVVFEGDAGDFAGAGIADHYRRS